MMDEFFVRFWSVDLEEPQRVGRFWCADEAEDFCDEQNGRLLTGIPSWYRRLLHDLSEPIVQ